MKRKLWTLLGVMLYWVMLPAIWIYAKNTKPRARVILVWQGKVLVVKNWLGAGGWSLPGGGLERGEPADAAASREVLEELGITLDPKDLLSLGQDTAVERGGLVSRYYLYGFEFQDEPDITAARAEIVAYAWLDFDQVLTAQKGVGNTAKQSVAAWLKR